MSNNPEIILLNDTNFDKEVLESAKPVVVEFVTEWSGACQIIDPVMKQLLKKFESRIKFCCVDIEKNRAIKEVYGIRDIPTLFFFMNGEVLDHVIGAASKRFLTGRIEDFLCSVSDGCS